MKRITNACLEQTLLFSLKDHESPAADRVAIRQEYEHYKNQMLRKRMKFEILAEEDQPDGTLLVRIRRQYNNYPCDAYLG